MSQIRRIITGLIILLGLIYGIFFSVQNMETVGVSLPFFGDYRVAAFVAYLSAFLVGVVAAGAYSSLELLRKTMEVRSLRKAVNGSQRHPYKRARRFLSDEEPLTKPEPSVHTTDSKEF